MQVCWDAGLISDREEISWAYVPLQAVRAPKSNKSSGGLKKVRFSTKLKILSGSHGKAGIAINLISLH
jgi:hypothetical protein